MNRRGFIGFLGGGAIAGVATAQRPELVNFANLQVQNEVVGQHFDRRTIQMDGRTRYDYCLFTNCQVVLKGCMLDQFVKNSGFIRCYVHVEPASIDA